MSRWPALARISDYPAWWAARDPDRTALVLGDRRISYADLAAAVDRLASALLAAGVGKGDRVATLQTPHPDYVTAFLATASIGAIWIGLNPRYRLEELRRIVTDAEPKVLLARTLVEGRDYAAELAALQNACPALERMVAFPGEPPAPGLAPMGAFLDAGGSIAPVRLDAARQACGHRDPCLIVYTSGSTGDPKGALLHHAGVVAAGVGQNRVWPVEPYRALNYFPINHIGCVVDCTIPCLVAGGTLVFMEHFDAAGSLALMARERISIWGSVPSTFQLQLALPGFEDHDLGAVDLIAWGGAAMPAETVERLARICPRLATNYSMTESICAIAAVAPTVDLDVLTNTVGAPFAGAEIRIADRDGAEVEDGQEGEVLVRSPCNFLGYWRRPEATADAFTPDGFLRTGDLAVRRPDGRLRLVGRIREMFKSGGYNVYPREIEAVLEAHPAVAVAAVVAVPDPLWQEVGVAYVETLSAVQPEELTRHCRERLANYKVPKTIVVTAGLPLLPIGKVDKRALMARAVRELGTAES